MTFIHKNVNSALLMLITFISVALVTATVYSVQAFDSVATDAVMKEQELHALKAELAQKQAMVVASEQTNQLNQEREKAFAAMLEQERQKATEQAAQQAITIPSEPATTAASQRSPYTPYRPRYWGWLPQKRYVV